jgi:hypothetical protein
MQEGGNPVQAKIVPLMLAVIVNVTGIGWGVPCTTTPLLSVADTVICPL